MGCQFNSGVYLKESKPTRNLIKEYLYRVIRNAKEDYGTRGYTGSFAEATGVIVKNLTFEFVEDAEKWLEENCKKGHEILVVRTATYWVYGANCRS